MVGSRESAIGAREHGWNDSLKHLDGLETDLLELADLAEVGHADGEVGEGSVANDFGEMLSVDERDEFEGVGRDSFCEKKEREGQLENFVARRVQGK